MLRWISCRPRPADVLIKLLHFNEAYKGVSATELFKVLVIDDFTLQIVATLLHTEALRQHGVTLVLAINKPREAIADAPVVYFISASPDNVSSIVHDLESGLYKEVCPFFRTGVPSKLHRIAQSNIMLQLHRLNVQCLVLAFNWGYL